jgi:hypothetical protein
VEAEQLATGGAIMVGLLIMEQANEVLVKRVGKYNNT